MKLSLSSANNRVKKNNIFNKNINFGLKSISHSTKTINIADIKLNIDTKLETITEVSETSSLNSPSINEIIKQSEKTITFYESVTEETQTEEIDEPSNESVIKELDEPSSESVTEEEKKEIIIEEPPKKKRGRKKKSNN